MQSTKTKKKKSPINHTGQISLNPGIKINPRKQVKLGAGKYIQINMGKDANK